MKREDLKLYLVTDRDLAQGRDIVDVVREAVAGGVTMVQLREKNIDTGEFIKLGIRLKAELATSGVPLIINDRVDVALACDADGVHIGQSDMPYAMARRLLGPEKIIGLSIENFDELEEANKLDVDYVAASPVFGTPTKTDTAEPWGLEGLAEFNRRSVHPTVAIGGMNIDTVSDVVACGTYGVAVVSAIIAAPDPRKASSELLAAIASSLRCSAADIPAANGSECAFAAASASSLQRSTADIPAAAGSSEISAFPHTLDSGQTNKKPDIDSAGFVGQTGEKSAADTGEDISSIGEFGLIDEIKSAFSGILNCSVNETPFGRHTSGVMGIGDDCAVIPQTTGVDTLVSTDMLVEGSHFLMNDISPFQLGWKSAAVNISDIAAMGGRPVGTFLSLALPKHLPVRWIRGFMNGYRQISEKYGVPLLGGDTTSSLDRLCVNVTVIGEIASGASKLRSSACVGDLVCVTGNLGDSAGGLQAILMGLGKSGMASAGEFAAKNSHLAEVLIQRHYLPLPRVEEGLALARCYGVHAMMDISDGIASDLRHILETSGVCAEISLASLPVSEELKDFCKLHNLDPYELAVSGGEDYELLFTVDPSAEPLIGVQHTVIGRIVDSPAQGASKCCGSLPISTGADNGSPAGTSASSIIINSAASPTGSSAHAISTDRHPDQLIKWIGADKDYLGFRHF